MSAFDDKMNRIIAEKQRLAEEEQSIRSEAASELERVDEEILRLEQRKVQLEIFLGIEEEQQRAGHGQLIQLCQRVITEFGGGMTSGEVKDAIEKLMPGMKLTSVPSTLSRATALGRLRRDENGRYFLS